MVTRIGQGRRVHLYIDEWFAERQVDDTIVAGRLDVDRTTVWKWRNQQHRLSPDKIAALAAALNIHPEQLWRPPTTRSLDDILKDASNEVRETAADIVERLVRRQS